MSAPVFLVPDLAAAAAGGSVRVGGAEGRHAVTVRRLRPGERVDLVDGRGRRAVGRVGTCRPPDLLGVDVDAVVDEPVPAPWLVVAQALPKGDRAGLAVELLTEVGVDEIVPWAAARCVATWRGPKADAGVQRWQAVAREAAKQARRARVPVVAALASTADLASRVASSGAAVVLHEEATTPLAALPLPREGDGPVLLVVGPEGGLDPEELARLESAGARAARLGPTVLRSSTAGAVAATVVSLTLARW